MPSLTQTGDSNARPALRGGDGDCAHRMRMVRQVRDGSRVLGVECDQPLRMVCRDCDHVEHWRCDTYGCGPCGETKRRRLMRVIEDGASSHVANGLRGYFLTITAPGSADHRRWVQGKQRGRTRPVCECHHHGLTNGAWNRQESACWNRLRTALAREREVIYAGAVETQKRGLLHRHVVLFTDSHLAFEEVQELALRAGYGCVIDVEPLENPAKAARYVAKYVTKSTAERFAVPWTKVELDHETGELVEVGVRATFRLWSASQRWGVTMKQLRDIARLQASARAKYLRELQALIEDDAAAAAGLAPAASTSTDPP